jgi:hypothetical protein
MVNCVATPQSSQSFYMSQLPTACPTCQAPLQRTASRKEGANFTRTLRACFKKDAARVNREGVQVTHYMEWENTAEECEARVCENAVPTGARGLRAEG